jgi:hypothetical protein
VAKLVSVCGWCPKDIYPALLPHQEYTHGLCDTHALIERQTGQLSKKLRSEIENLMQGFFSICPQPCECHNRLPDLAQLITLLIVHGKTA